MQRLSMKDRVTGTTEDEVMCTCQMWNASQTPPQTHTLQTHKQNFVKP